MSRSFGPVRQNGYVVHDVEAAMQHWTRVLGVGPFFYFSCVEMDYFRYRGSPSALDVSIALANSGSLQIELIQQRNEAPSMYRDFLDAGREGLQHIAYWTRDMDGALEEIVAANLSIGQSGAIGENGRFVYLETETHPGSVVEVSEITGDKGRFFEKIARVAEEWDGSDPIRPLGKRS